MTTTTTREELSSFFLKAAGKRPFDGNFDPSIYNNVAEEVTELLDAMLEYVDDPCVETRANLCKEWADAQVVLSNAAWYFDIPAQEALVRVTDNNNTKIIDGKVRIREDGKVLKPEGYVKADMRGL